MRCRLLLCLLLVLPLLAVAAQGRPMVAIVIDDLGNNPELGMAALDLPGELVYSILPNTPYATLLAEIAHERGKQVMLHLPMEAEHHRNLGPNALLSHMSEHEFKAMLDAALLSVPYAVGLNNHMGSLLTQLSQQMQWLMETLRRHNLFFIDSRTSSLTVAEQVALANGVPALRRDVFLDNQREFAAIRQQFELLLAKARRHGFATGIAHPYPETISALQQLLPSINKQGLELVSASKLAMARAKLLEQQRSVLWEKSLCHLPRVAKNLKR